MPTFRHSDALIHYEDTGNPAGPPVLLIAPGGMRSTIAAWSRSPWNPLERLAAEYRLIAMDQRNAGASQAPVRASDSWETYRADQLALLDHLGVERCHVIGMCIGGPYIVALLRAAPERFERAVLMQPVGIENNRDAFEAMFDAWMQDIASQHPETDGAAWASFRDNMWGGDFVLTASPADLETVETPMLVLMGHDLYHPESTSREIVRRAPNARLIERWKDAEVLAATHAHIHDFLA